MKYFKFLLYLAVIAGFYVAHAGSYEDFLFACENDRGYEIRKLLTRGFDPNTVDKDGNSGMYIALRADSVDAAEALLQHPSLDVNQANAAGETPLMMAALRGRTALMERLVARGAKVNKDGWTPLHYAASSPEPAPVAWLLERGAVIDALSPNGTTPVMMAAGYGAIDAADLLAKRGADLTRRNAQGMTAGDFARMQERDKLGARLDKPTSPR